MTDKQAERERFVPALGLDWLTPVYDPLLRLTTRERRFRQRLLAQAEIHDGHKVLDVGCGTGTLAVLVKRTVLGASVTGVDADPKILARARRKAEESGQSIEFDEGFSYELPYPDASFDRVLSTLVFHHLTRREKEQTAHEVARVLNAGGELHVADWGKPTDLVMEALSLWVRLFDGLERTRDNVRGALPRIFEDAGLKPESEFHEMRTMYGTLAFYSAQKPALDRPV